MSDSVSALTGESLGLTAVTGRLLMPREVARFLRVSERYVQQLIQDGDLPVSHFPISTKVQRIASEDLNNYLAKIRAEAGSALLPTGAVKKIGREEVSA